MADIDKLKVDADSGRNESARDEDMTADTDVNVEIRGDNRKEKPSSSSNHDMVVVDKRCWVREQQGEFFKERVPSLKPTYVEELEQKISDLEAKLSQTYHAHRTREQELEKVRERLERDKEKRLLLEKGKIFRKFLEPLDNLERCLAAARQSQNTAGLADGLDMVFQQFLSALAASGVERFNPVGEPFNPEMHEAISMIEVENPDSSSRVHSVYQSGYRLGEIILRPARVVVAKGAGSPNDD